VFLLYITETLISISEKGTQPTLYAYYIDIWCAILIFDHTEQRRGNRTRARLQKLMDGENHIYNKLTI
jgi:hypothetical protein